MPNGFDVVQIVVSDGVKLPAYRIVKGMGAGIAPVAVEVVFLQRGAGAHQFE